MAKTAMRINEFFAKRLKAKLANPVWSWGAVSDSNREVFLRKWSGNVDHYDDGKEWAVVYDPKWNSSPGHPERRRHLESANRLPCYGVVYEVNDHWRIRSFDDQTLLRLGNFTEEGRLTFAEVVERVSIDDLVE